MPRIDEYKKETTVDHQSAFEEVLGVELRVQSNGEAKQIRCPLQIHDDSTPSFAVNTQKGVWHCFGCLEGGNLYQLAQRLGKPLPHNRRS